MDRDRRRPRLFGPHPRGVAPVGRGAFSALTALSGLVIGATVVLVSSLLTLLPVAAGTAAAAKATAAPMTAAASATAAAPSSLVSATSADPPITLLTQTSWVTPGQGFDLHLRIADAGRATTQLGLAVSVYPCLSTVSGFDQSLSASGPGDASGSTSQPVPLDSLPSLGDGAVDLSMPVVVDSGPKSGASYTIDLVPTSNECQAFPAGVFPVRIQLVDLQSSAVLGSLTTHLVYSETSAATDKLRVAVVLPVQLALSASGATPAELAARPTAALRTPSVTALATLGGEVAAMADHSTVDVTMSVSGQALVALSDTGHQTTIDDLSGLALDTTGHQVLFAPFVPVDATALVDAGLADELELQVARGAQVSAAVTHQVPAPSTAPGLGAWVTNATVDSDTVDTLSAAGYRQVVVPPSAVDQPPTNGSTAVPFTVSSSHGSQLEAVASSPDLAARFTSSSDPVLAAHQLVAELAQIFYEAPNADTPRGVVVVPPTGWQANPTFVDALLGALDGNPVLQAVTINGLLAAVPASSTCQLDCRLTPGSRGPTVPAAAISDQRQRVNAFASAAVGVAARNIVSALSDLVLAGQSDLLRPDQQASAEAAAGRAIDAQLARVAVAGDKSVTLTSQQGSLPVTIASSAPYDVDATLTLSSDKLIFPNGGTQWTRPGTVTVLPAPHTNVIDVPVRSRGSGVFPVEIILRSPSGDLQLSSGTITLRSTATSVVAIVLSVGAVAVLAAWWIRTSRRRRAERQRLEASHEPPVPAGVS